MGFPSWILNFVKFSKNGIVGTIYAIKQHYGKILTLFFAFLLLAPAFKLTFENLNTDGKSLSDARPLYDDVIVKIGGAGVYYSNEADRIEQNGFNLPIDRNTYKTDYVPKESWYSFFPNTYNKFKSWINRFFNDTKNLFKSIWYLLALAAPAWFTYYIIRIIYIFVWSENTSKIIRALGWSIFLAFIVVNLSYGIADAHSKKTELTGVDYEEAVLTPIKGYFKIVSVLYNTALIDGTIIDNSINNTAEITT